jgi:hypothetical protein
MFDASAKSVEGLFSQEAGLGYYLPPYQRPYSWSKDSIDHLLGGIRRGLCYFLENEPQIETSPVTFLGSIILVKVLKPQEVIIPAIRNELPTATTIVIDGQQRLTTIMLLLLKLHQKLSCEVEQGDSGWLNRLLKAECDTLKKHLVISMGSDSRDYPRMIRAIEDQWSRDSRSCEYQSPISKVIDHYFNNPNEKFALWSEGGMGNLGYGKIDQNLKYLEKGIDRIIDYDPVDDQVFQDEELEEGNFDRPLNWGNFDIPERDLERKLNLYKEQNPDVSILNSKVLRLLVLAKYIQKYVILTKVVAENEAYACDIFEALNTTGEPLTAIETFKALAFRSVAARDGGVNRSQIKAYYDEIDKIHDPSIATRAKAEDRQKFATSVLIPFAMVCDGFKLSRHLRDQRDFLARKFNVITDKDQFVRGLLVSSQVLQLWDDSSLFRQIYSDINNETEVELSFTLELLKSFNHKISITVLIYMVERGYPAQEFLRVAKAMVALFVLWRLSRQNTDQIDAKYRRLFSTNGILFAKKEGNPSASKIIAALREILKEGKIDTGDKWLNAAHLNNVYSQHASATRALLVLILRRSAWSAQDPGVLEPARIGANQFADFNILDPSRYSIEHIAPQRPLGPSLISEDLIDTLGNLTILPVKENSQLGRLTYLEKRNLYIAFAERNEVIARDILKKLGYGDSQVAEMVARPVVEHLSQFRDISEWNDEVVQVRSRSLASRAWQVFAEDFLEWSSE